LTPLPKLYTVEQAAEYFIVPKGTVLQWIKMAKLPAFKVGKHWRISEEAMEEFLASGYKGCKPQPEGE
jgi:excisionase family DNA binding protein